MQDIVAYIPLASLIAVSVSGFLVWREERNARLAVENRFRNVLEADREAAAVYDQATSEANRINADAERRASSILSDAARRSADILRHAETIAEVIKVDAAEIKRLSEDEAGERDAVSAVRLAEAHAAAEAIVEKAASEERQMRDRISLLHSDISDLQKQYSEKRQVYDRLATEVAILDERLAFAEMGIYEPHFDFADSEQFKAAIIDVREKQKAMVAANSAVVCPIEWTVDGSRSKGKTMTGRNIRLTLRAFNNECDAAIANTRWNNANAMEKRIVRAKEQIDKLNESNKTTIASDYLALKLRELRLTHECREKLKAEREERAEIARLAREELRLLRDMEEAQRDQEHYERLLAKAKQEAASVAGQKLEAFGEQIRLLERDLAAAREKAERAQALAERTSCGYVYVISNVGSFGSDVVKIGLTRRLDPMDRVRELGDASVPFVFDTHAIIYSEDAPALERALHAEFEAVRINTENYRKEFFRVTLPEVEDAVRRLAPEAPFFRDIEAQEYRETLSRREATLGVRSAGELFPGAI